MTHDFKLRVRCRNRGTYQEFALKCPPHIEADDFARLVITCLRGSRGMAVCIDTLNLQVRYGINTAGYARKLVAELKKYGLLYRMRKYFGDRPPDFLRRILDKFTGRREHCIIAFAVPLQEAVNDTFRLSLPSEGAVFYICQEEKDLPGVMESLVAPGGLTNEIETFAKLYCIVSDSSEFGELTVCSKDLSLEEIEKAVQRH